MKKDRIGFGALGCAVVCLACLCSSWLPAKAGDGVDARFSERVPAFDGAAAKDGSALSGAHASAAVDEGPVAAGSASVLTRGADRETSSVMQRGTTSRRQSPFESGGTPWYRSGLVSTFIVLGVVWLTYRVVRRWVPGGKVSENGVMQVVARTTLTPKQHVALVRLGHRFVMVGVSPDRIDRLCLIDDAPEVAELLLRMNGASGAQPSGFDETLMHEVIGYESDADVEEAESVPSNGSSAMRPAPLRALVTRLKSLQHH